jgi:hypothetical protein
MASEALAGAAAVAGRVRSVTSRRNAVNTALHAIGLTYHESLPIGLIGDILAEHGFDPAELGGIYTGNDGTDTTDVGERTFLRLSWHRMPSGRWEIVAYVS